MLLPSRPIASSRDCSAPPTLADVPIRYEALQPVLDERSRRVWAGAEAQAIGRGGIARVAEATGMARDTVRQGLRQVQAGGAEMAAAGSERQRRPGGGRKKLAERDPQLRAELERKLDPVTHGDPMGPLRWACLSAARLADESGLRISVFHFPPGTSKWNKIKHRMFCHITQNWRGRPLVSREVIVNLIGAVTTKEGLRIESALDENRYEFGRKVSDAELKRLSIERAEFHGEWNYTIVPRPLRDEVI